MNLFLCHTPLHIMVSLIIESQNKIPRKESIFFIIEDSPGLHCIAEALIEKKKSTKLWVIDSADALGLTAIQIKELIMQNHKKAIAIVGWGKGGGAKGSAGEAGVFLAGLKVNIKDFVATTISRFGGNNQPFVINERMAAERSAKINYYTR